MKRRDFLAALLALPFAPKVVKAEPWVPKSAKRTPEEWKRYIDSQVANRVAELNTRLFDLHRHRVQENSYWLRMNTEALLRNAPSGWKVDSYRFKKLPEKK